jgi:type IV pilus assembly protein PilO
MTVAEDFVPGSDQEGSEYPTAFGITFSPKITLIICTIIGIGGTAYILLQMVLPAWTEYQELVTKKEDTTMQLNQQKVGDAEQKINDLRVSIEQQKNRQPQVLALLSSERTVDTLLIDFNRIFQEENVVLKTYSPSGLTPEEITDGSFGELVNGKLKRRSISIAFEGTIAQTQSIIRRLERFQSLVIIKNFNATVNQKPTFVFNQGQVKPEGELKLNVSFVADVIYPLSSEELAEKEAQAQAEAAAAEQPPQ